jgi:hypothetical protein
MTRNRELKRSIFAEARPEQDGKRYLGSELSKEDVRLVQRHPVNPENFVVIFTKAPRFRLLSSDEPHR